MFGQLKNLQELNLTNTKQLKCLPEETGNLGSLIKLSLDDSGIRLLNPSIKYALACSRFRFRAVKAPIGNHCMTMGWPVILENAIRSHSLFIIINYSIILHLSLIF